MLFFLLLQRNAATTACLGLGLRYRLTRPRCTRTANTRTGSIRISPLHLRTVSVIAQRHTNTAAVLLLGPRS